MPSDIARDLLAAHDLLVAILAADCEEDAVPLIRVALDRARGDGIEEAARWVRPTSAEFASLPRPVVAELVERAQQLTGAAVRVRAGKPAFGKAPAPPVDVPRDAYRYPTGGEG